MSTRSSPLARRARQLALSVAVFAAVVLVAGLAATLNDSVASEAAVRIPPAAVDETRSVSGMQTAVFAGGCFWGVQGVFQRVEGVVQAVSGYSGGAKETARYELIGSGMTGHAEAVQITYDPKKVSYATLLQVYFSVAHDPTQLNRQEPDVGPQYRSAVFYVDAAQKQTVEGYIAQLDAAKVYPKKIVTEVVPLQAFYPAEEYHQDYLTLNPTQPYIARYDLPKIVNLKTVFPQQYRAQPALVTARAQALIGRPPQ
jgi:peptide-methionine (S)-S-oxide reductase